MTPRTVSQSSSNVWRNTWDKKPLELLKIFETADVLPTIWACPVTMGIESSVEHLLEDMGLGQLHTFDLPTYVEPTINFFSSFHIFENHNGDDTINGYLVSIMIMAKRFVMSIEELCSVYGFPMNDSVAYGQLQEARELWKTLSGETWAGDDARMLKIRNPAIRYTARLVANTMFARRDTSKVKKCELAHHLGNAEFLGTKVNNGFIFLENFFRLRRRLKPSKHPVLCFGGFLTPLFTYLGIDLEAFQRLEKIPKMNLDYLINIKSNSGIDVDDHYLHNLRVNNSIITCRLPLPGLVEPTSAGNIEFEILESLYSEPPRTGCNRRQPRQRRRGTTPHPKQEEEVS